MITVFDETVENHIILEDWNEYMALPDEEKDSNKIFFIKNVKSQRELIYKLSKEVEEMNELLNEAQIKNLISFSEVEE